VIFALLIFFTWLYYLMSLDIYEKEKPLFIVLTILAGFTTSEIALPIYDFFTYVLDFELNGAFWNDLLYCVFGIGFIEEFVKIIPLMLLMVFTKEPNDTYDYLLYGSISALAFATSENIMYFGDNRLAGYSGRSMYAVIMHLSCTSIASYGWLLASFKNKFSSKLIYVAVYFFMACTLHGLYDFFIFRSMSILFYLGFLGSVVVWIVMLNNSLNNSKFFSYSIAVQSTNLRMFIGIALLLLFVSEYVYYGFRDGRLAANQFFTSNAIGFTLLTFFFTSKLAQFDLIKGFWRTVQWKDVTETKEREILYPWEWPGMIFRFFFNFFDLNSIKPQNYVGMKLKIYLANENQTFGPKWMTLSVIDRIVILNRNPETRKVYQDPNWFVGLTHEHSDDFDCQRFYLFKTENKSDLLSKNNRAIVELSVPERDEILSKKTISFNEIKNLCQGLASKTLIKTD
ncbi:MAG: PrsW family glutamic-type intramembrane protease, partial [Cytophagales bacterium]